MGLLSRFRRAPLAAAAPPAAAAELDAVDATEAIDAALKAGLRAAALRRVDAQIQRHPGDPEWARRRARILLDWGRLREASEWTAKAAALGDTTLELALLDGAISLAAGAPERTERAMRAVLAFDPSNAAGLRDLAVALYAQRRLDEARIAFRDARARSPGSFAVLHAFANLEYERGDVAAAEALLREAIALDPVCAIAWKDLAVILTKQDRHDEAMTAAKESARLATMDGSDGGVFANLAICLRDDGQVTEAIELLRKHLPEHPSVDGYYALAMALLTAGRLREGWDAYEFRWLKSPLRELRSGGRPAWTGQPLEGRTLLLRIEQGIGDTLQMIRYVPALKALETKLVMSRFDPIVEGIDGIDVLLGPGEAHPYDFYVNLLSLPRIFGTDLDSIPARVPYLTLPRERLEKWQARLPADGSMRIGLAWAGSPGHTRDRYRSMRLAQLAPLAELPGIRWYSLQKGPAEAELDGLREWKIERLGPELHDLVDAGAAMQSLDLVITVDTALAHLAGALGRPVWMLSAFPADWRWLTPRDDSPWYPTMRVFFQRVRGDWSGVVNDVLAALKAGIAPSAFPAAVASRSQLVPSPDAWRCENLRQLDCVTETRYGIVQLSDSGTDEVMALKWGGEWLEGQSELVFPSVASDGVVLFAGAGSGSRILAFARHFGDRAQAWVVETSPVRLRVLIQNLIANERAATVLDGRLDGDSEEETVDGLRPPVLDWIICEGGVDVSRLVAGASDALWRLRPSLWVPVVDDIDSTMLAEQIRGFGYRVWRRDEPLHRADNFNLRSSDVLRGGALRFLIGIPEEVAAELPHSFALEI